MLPYPRSAVFAGIAICLLTSLTACANGPAGEALQKSLAADPRLKDNRVVLGQPNLSTPTNSPSNPTPADPSVASQNIEPGTDAASLNESNSNLADQQSSNPNAAVPQPGDPDFIGPVLSLNGPLQTSTPASNSNNQSVAASAQSFSDLSKTPQSLRQYVEDLAALGAFPPRSSRANSQADQRTLFEPNKTITRREYARWLVAINNLMHSDRPAQQIRLGLETSQPAFQDVPRTDLDFAVIQGLAETGIVPSPLSGDATTVTFRPNAPLTRESLVLWKVPLDTRQALPTATIEAVKQTWGFQDAARIEPRALRAVLIDFQNGDLANIRRAFGYTTLFQPKKPVTRAEAAAALWYFGFQGEGQSAQAVLKAGRQPNQTNQTNQTATVSSPGLSTPVTP